VLTQTWEVNFLVGDLGERALENIAQPFHVLRVEE
jgi:hypothetical protein